MGWEDGTGKETKEKEEKGGDREGEEEEEVVGGIKWVQLQAEHHFSLLNKRFHGAVRCLAETAECH